MSAARAASAAKRALRASIRRRRCAVEPESRERSAEAVAARLVDTMEWRSASRVALYSALPDELPTGPLHQAARVRGLPVLWPRILGERLEFALCEEGVLVPGRFGVLAPPARCPACGLVQGDLVIVPALAFDASGRRLGRGGGYYDRVLADLPARASSVAIGYDFQQVDAVPAEDHDVAVSMVVTDAGIHRRLES